MAVLIDRFCMALITPEAGEPFIIEKLRISFNVQKNIDQEQNSAEINIYNLSKASAGQITENAGVVLTAGYYEVNGVVFAGVITEAKTVHRQADRVTTIKASDGHAAYKTVAASLSYKPGTSAKTVLRALLNRYGVPYQDNGIISAAPEKEYLTGYQFAGFLHDAIKDVAGYLGINQTTQDNELILYSKDSRPGDEMPILSNKTGLIGSIEPYREKESDTVTKSGILCSCLMLPSIRPNQPFATVSENGDKKDWIVNTANYLGDTHGQEWKIDIKAEQAA